MMDQLTYENGVPNAQTLPATDDEFGGVVIEMKEHMDSNVFRSLLRTSMARWKLQGKKGVWIKLPIDLSNLVDSAVKEGFWYHHAEPEYLMLLYWIPKTINPIPGNASHIARVGAIVLNDKQEMLVVQEKMGILRGVWKISTGIIHQGEDISVGVVREVKEETGIDTEFIEVLAFSQEHKVFFGKSEVLFLCMLRPLSFDIKIQETEIDAAQWMPMEEYTAQLSSQEQGLREYITQLCVAKLEKKYTGFTPFSVTTDSDGQALSKQNDERGATWLQTTFPGSGGGGDGDSLPIHCEYSCEPPPSRPLYGTPSPPQSPPSEPVYESPPPPPLPSPRTEPVYGSPPPPSTLPPSRPVYETPPSPTGYSCEPPPAPSLPSGPLYGLPPPPPPALLGNCQPTMQNCVPPPPSPDVYQTVDTASCLALNCLHVLVVILLLVLHF